MLSCIELSYRVKCGELVVSIGIVPKRNLSLHNSIDFDFTNISQFHQIVRTKFDVFGFL